MPFSWSKDLETGNVFIDDEHRQLIQALNDLLDACARGAGREELESTVKFLWDYVHKHFRNEEALQLSCGYPGYESHKKAHEEFALVVAQFNKELERDGPTAALLNKVSSRFGRWLTVHIRLEDKKIADYIRFQSQ